MKMEQAMPAMADLNTVCGGLGGGDYTTGNASLDDPRNQDGIGEDELLAVSFGTSFNDSRRLTIGAMLSRAGPSAGPLPPGPSLTGYGVGTA